VKLKFWKSKNVNDLKKKFISGGYLSTYIISGQPVWLNLTEYSHYLNTYITNPILSAVIDIRARYASNMLIQLVEVDTDEVIDKNHKRYKEFESFLKVLKQPNPLQSTWEWLKYSSINLDVFGNSYDYFSIPAGSEKNYTYKDINVINNVYPYVVAPILTGKWLDATSIDEIVSEYELNMPNGRKRRISSNQILHINYPNLTLDSNWIRGESKIKSLSKPISNINAALESRNVLIRRRGALGAWTPEGKDPVMGATPLEPKEKEQVQEDFKDYGMMEDQYLQVISRYPLKYQQTALPVKDLMLFEEIATDAIYIANQYGVPEILLKNYFQGTTYENQEASERRMYQSTTIPESNEKINAFNTFLKLENYGVKLRGSFNHIPVLQKDLKDQATAKSMDSKRLKELFFAGAIVYDDWLIGTGIKADKQIGSKRIWDLTPEQIAVITSKPNM
jgi:hypothetical protein